MFSGVHYMEDYNNRHAMKSNLASTGCHVLSVPITGSASCKGRAFRERQTCMAAAHPNPRSVAGAKFLQTLDNVCRQRSASGGRIYGVLDCHGLAR